MKKILLVEDDSSVWRSYMRYFEAASDFEIEVVTTVEEAREFIQERLSDSFVAIIFDGSMNDPEWRLNTDKLPKLALEVGFAGIMIANSADRSFKNALMQAGCTHSSPSKAETPDYVIGLLEKR